MIIKVKINGILQEIDAITYFENIDINNEPKLNLDNVVHSGEIGESYVKDNYNVLIQQMFYLKKDICYLTDNAKLKFIEGKFAELKPQNPNFDHVVVNQAFFQLDVYWCEFIKEYKEYLSQKIESDEILNKTDVYATFANDIEERLAFDRKIYVFNGQLYLIREEEKQTFLKLERQKVFNDIKNSDLFTWWPKTENYYDIVPNAWNLDRRKLLINYASNYSQQIKYQFQKGLNNPYFEFKAPELMEFITNMSLLNHIDDCLNKYSNESKSQQSNEPQEMDNKKKSEIFWNEVERRFNIRKKQANEYLEKILKEELQIETLETWINNVESLYQNDIDYNNPKCLMLKGVVEINFTVHEFAYLRDIKEKGYNYIAITSENFEECAKRDFSLRNLNLQSTVAEFDLLKGYFQTKLNQLENNIKSHKIRKETISSNKELLKLTGTNIEKLVFELKRHNFFDEVELIKVQNWFKGIKPKEKIELNKPANHFISVIADLQEYKKIKNTKEFLYKSINESYLSKNKEITCEYIKKVMKPGSENRISQSDKTNYININNF